MFLLFLLLLDDSGSAIYNKLDVNAWIESRLNHSLRVKGS